MTFRKAPKAKGVTAGQSPLWSADSQAAAEALDERGGADAAVHLFALGLDLALADRTRRRAAGFQERFVEVNPAFR